jgi:hypothetical protein
MRSRWAPALDGTCFAHDACMMNPRCTRPSVLLAMLALLTLACGSKSGLKDAGSTGGAAGASQTGGSGGEPGTGGKVGSGGEPGSGGKVGSGGAPGTGGKVGSGGAPGTGGKAVDNQDAGGDAPPAVDAAIEVAARSCGDAGACGPGQACVLSAGGPVPRCQAQEDGGACSFGLVPVDTCGSPSGMAYGPGCSDPTPAPKCLGLADGCGDPCSCVCPGAGCYQGPGYTICAYP